MGEMRRMPAANLAQDSDNGCADASWTCSSPKGARSRRSRLRNALHLALLLAGCTAVASESGGHGISNERSSTPGSWWRWLRDLATGSRRGAADWGVSMDAAWKTDVELCSRKQVVDAFFEDSDKDKSGTLSQEEWTTACAELRTNICAKWEEACRAQLDDVCTAEWEKTCLEESKKNAERLAIEQNVFYEMGSRAVISEPDDDGLISGDGEITLAEFQEPIVPYVSGIWQFTYEYNEMVGPRSNLQQNPCYGPFPYRYTWTVYIWQKVENKNGTRRTTGDIRVCWYDWMDCQQDSRAWKIAESNPDILRSKCRFKGYDEHPNDWFRFPGYMQGGYQREIVPTNKDGKRLPVRLWDAFKVPNVRPAVWGTFCEQFSWFDGKTAVKNTPQPLYEGTWRHDNESWVIVRDISTCPCFPACRRCEEKIRGTQFKQVLESDGGACLGEYDTVAAQCSYVVRGVSGGPVRYPFVTTGVDLAENGEDDQVCFAFANIKGVKVKGPEFLPTIRDISWDSTGIPAENTDPLLDAQR